MLDDFLGLSLKAEELGYIQLGVRALLIYILLLVIVRVGKKRFLGRATAFDVVLVIIVGSVAARAMTGGSPFFPAVISIAVLVAFHWAMSWVSARYPSVSTLLKGSATPLIRNGRLDHAALREAHMSEDDLDEDLRAEGVTSVKAVSEARLERSGRLSVVRK
jgi:uncharacterized membrane protein YcaP (DUF421 family)